MKCNRKFKVVLGKKLSCFDVSDKTSSSDAKWLAVIMASCAAKFSIPVGYVHT